MLKYLLLVFLFLVSYRLISQDYIYPRDPNQFISQIEKSYPNQIDRVYKLNEIIFDIYHYVSTFTEDNFFLVTNDYFGDLIKKTKQDKLLTYYYYVRASIKYHQHDGDSSLFYYKRSLELARFNKIQDIEVHSTISIGVQNVISSDTLVKYLSNFLKLGFNKSNLSTDNFAKAAGAWSMMEYHIKNSKNVDSILYYRKLSFENIEKIPKDRLSLKNFSTLLTEGFTYRFFSKNNDEQSKELVKECLENTFNAIKSKENQKLIDFKEIINHEKVLYYLKTNNLDSAKSISLRTLNQLENELPFMKLQFLEHLGSIYYLLGDYKNAYFYEKKKQEFQNKFIDNNESIKRVARLRELESQNYQEKIKTEETQKKFISIIVVIIILFSIIIIIIIWARYNKIKSLNTKLDEANSTKNKLFTVISHDLNNPVNSTIMLSEQLVDFGNKMDREDIIKNSEGILQSGKHLKGLLESLIEWSKVNLDEMKKREGFVNIKTLLDSIYQDVETNLKWKNIELKYEIDDNLVIEFDQNALRVVLRNLITNSIKFTNVNGKIIIRGNKDKIEIEDTGIGFSQEQINHGFKNKQTKLGTNQEKGMGLGLQIVKDICQMYNTNIEISNIVSGGGLVKLLFNKLPI